MRHLRHRCAVRANLMAQPNAPLVFLKAPFDNGAKSVCAIDAPLK